MNWSLLVDLPQGVLTAHYASIRNGGKTIGVIGTQELDVFYQRNQRLQAYGERDAIWSWAGMVPVQAPQVFIFLREIASLQAALSGCDCGRGSTPFRVVWLLVACYGRKAGHVFAIPGSGPPDGSNLQAAIIEFKKKVQTVTSGRFLMVKPQLWFSYRSS